MLPAAVDSLSFEQTIPRSLVHKRSLENVLVTQIKACGEDRFVCAGRVPTAHRFFNESGRNPQRDILFYSELGRQCSIAISHAFLDVDQDDVFIFEGSTAAITEVVWRSPQPPSSDSVVVDVRLCEVARRRNVVSRVVGDYSMVLGGEIVFSATGAWTIQSRALFDRLRRASGKHPAPTQPVPDHQSFAARRHASQNQNVVIDPPAYVEATTEFVTRLIVDQTHPYFFDHPCDHVPGVLILEGCAQLTAASLAQLSATDLTRVSICGYEVSFGQFVERDLPTMLTARVANAATDAPGMLPLIANIVISQQNTVSGTATMRVGLAG